MLIIEGRKTSTAKDNYNEVCGLKQGFQRSIVLITLRGESTSTLLMLCTSRNSMLKSHIRLKSLFSENATD